jgi:LEA14-like dessication related protein
MSKKSSNSNLLVIGAVAVAAWYFFTRASSLNSLVFVPKGMGVQGIGVNLVLGVQNPTNNPLTLASLAGSLIVNGAAIGNVSDFQQTTIAANSETDINVLITPNVFGVAAGAIDALEGNETSNISAALQGTANVNGVALPVNVTFS